METAPYLSLLALVVAVLVARAVTRERAEYQKFKRLRSTVARQKVYRRWLVESFVLFGGMGMIVVLAVVPELAAVVSSARSWAPLAALREWFGTGVGMFVLAALGTLFLAIILSPLLLLLSRNDEEATPLVTVGDVQALLPRTRDEMRFGIALSINAGVVEELLFRLALPALVFAVTGAGVASFLAASVLFGLLHLYQGWVGIAASTLLGLAFSLLYVLSGSLALVMIVHALVDLRSLALVPWVLARVAERRATTAPDPVQPAAEPPASENRTATDS